MTELLQQAIAELKKLTTEQQNAIASRILEELKDEQIWSSSFQSTTDEQWDQLAAMVRKDIAEGNTIAVDEAFPN
jgi:hypothetical protein